jgi:hypothetical protein
MPWRMQAPAGPQGWVFAIGPALLLLAAVPRAVQALEPQSGEKQAILDCERRLCTMLQQKSSAGGDLKCELSKTWVRSDIKGAEQSTLKWGFGDARCSVHIHIGRALIAVAMTARGKDFKLWIPPHTANCVVELDGTPRAVTATLAPKLLLRDGRVEKIWVNLTGVDAPAAIKATLWAAAKLADDVGLFQRPMLKSVNRFIDTTCPRKYPLAGAAAQKR